MTTIVGFEGAVVPGAAGVLPVVAASGEGFELIRSGQDGARVAIDSREFERAIERGLFQRLERELNISTSVPVLLYVPERPLLEPWARWHRERHWMELIHSPEVERVFHRHSLVGLVTSHTRAHDLLRLLLEETVGALRLSPGRPQWHGSAELRLFLRSASAILKDANLRERVFGVLFAQVLGNESKWNALVRDAEREFSPEALERIKRDAIELHSPRGLSASAG